MNGRQLSVLTLSTREYAFAHLADANADPVLHQNGRSGTERRPWTAAYSACCYPHTERKSTCIWTRLGWPHTARGCRTHSVPGRWCKECSRGRMAGRAYEAIGIDGPLFETALWGA